MNNPVPSLRQLTLATMAALVAATIILVLVVLPAEYSIDPTGLGARMGLLRPSGTTDAASLGFTLPTGSKEPITKDPTPFRTDELTLTLDYGEGAEIKASMKAGQRFVYSWTSDGGEVDFDMHGEPFNAPKDVFTSYWKEESKTSANGSFEAPFDGKHGWFWENAINDKKITIKLKISGYYDAVSLQ